MTAQVIMIPRADESLYHRVDQALQLSRLYREAFAIELLNQCMTHLTDSRKTSCYPHLDDGDIAAWNLMEELRDFLLNGSRCIHCGEAEGAHTTLGAFCVARGVPMFKRFTPKVLQFSERL